LAAFRPDSYKSYDLCDLCGGTVYDLDIKSIRSERNTRYRALFEAYRAAKRAGKTHKIWQIAGGITTRQSHRDANAQKVGIDEAFRVGGEDLFLPNDPEASLSETANCRCSVKYVGKNISNVSEEDDIRRRTEREGEFQAEMQALRDKLDALVRQNPRAVAARRRDHEAAPKKHYKTQSGVNLSAAIAQRINLLADEYYILTGEDTVVTSAVRSPGLQARLMYDGRIEAGGFIHYRRSTAFLAVEKIFNEGRLAGKSRLQIIQEMTVLITAQAKQDIFVSLHLNERAVDIRSRNMSPQQEAAFIVAARKFNAKVITESDHLHVQFN